jgi:hypothetical protein
VSERSVPRLFFFHLHLAVCKPVCVLDAVRAAGWLARIPEAEAALPAADTHPRTYSLTASGPSGELFLVTDDESGINIGHAKQIGGPLTAPMRATLPTAPTLVEALKALVEAVGHMPLPAPSPAAVAYRKARALLATLPEQEEGR